MGQSVRSGDRRDEEEGGALGAVEPAMGHEEPAERVAIDPAAFALPGSGLEVSLGAEDGGKCSSRLAIAERPIPRHTAKFVKMDCAEIADCRFSLQLFGAGSGLTRRSAVLRVQPHSSQAFNEIARAR